MPLYGQSFTLENTRNTGLNSKAPGPGKAGEFTRAAGFLAYYEVSFLCGEFEEWYNYFNYFRFVIVLSIKAGKWYKMNKVEWVLMPIRAINGFHSTIRQ